MIAPIVIPDATARPAEYVRALLETLGTHDALAVYRDTPARVSRICEGLDDDAWLRPMGAGEWSAVQIVGHLLDVDIVYGFRWRLALTLDEPDYPGYDEKRWSMLARPPIPVLLAAFSGLRAVNVALLANLDETAWCRKAVHGEQGPEDLRRMLDKVAGHDLAHCNQLDRTIAAVTR